MKLEIQHLSAGYGEGDVLRDLSLQVAQGEFLSLLGPSGCGKTTLMKTIAGILPSAQGRILLDGREIQALPVHRRGTVVVFQDIRLFPHKSVAENVAYPMKLRGVPKAERREKARWLLEKVRLPELGERRPTELSGGQQQRVALARALAAEPKLLLLDEPFSALDENLRADMRALVERLRREFAMTVLLVTHDREEALSLSDRVALLFDGQIAQIGTPMQVYATPANRRVAAYFGDCVYLRGSVRAGMFRSPLLSAATAREEGEYDLLLRSQNVELCAEGETEAVVTARHYYGATSAVELELMPSLRVVKYVSALPQAQCGEKIRCRIRVAQPVLFPAEDRERNL